MFGHQRLKHLFLLDRLEALDFEVVLDWDFLGLKELHAGLGGFDTCGGDGVGPHGPVGVVVDEVDYGDVGDELELDQGVVDLKINLNFPSRLFFNNSLLNLGIDVDVPPVHV